MKITCKNQGCRHYWELDKKEHCQAEDECSQYMSNKKKGKRQILKCKDCEFCKRIYTNQGEEYHYECNYQGRRKTILMVGQRCCDCRI